MKNHNTQINGALILGTALSAALVLGGCAAGESRPDSSVSASTSQTGEQETRQTGEANSADVMFAQMMLPHHEQAMEMSDILLAKEGLDPAVSDLAEQIKAAQGPEIETLNGWLTDWGVDTGAVDHGSMDHGGMDGMLSADDLTAIEQSGAEEATRLYLEGMIEHHEGAVDMAEQEVADGQDPQAVEMAQTIIKTQNAEIETMRQLLAQGPTAVGSAGASASDTPVSGDPAMLADHGLADRDARAIIEELDTLAVAERPEDLIASVGQDDLVLGDAAGREVTLALPEDEVYLSAAPYDTQTHQCHFHSLTTCLGELQNAPVHVTVVDAQSGEVLLDEDRTTYDNGFVGMWLPRGIEAELTVEYQGRTATTAVSTKNPDDPTCLTGLQLS